MKLKLNKHEANILMKFLGAFTDEEVESVMETTESDYSAYIVNESITDIYTKLRERVDPHFEEEV